jgi:hypothetical protein
MKLAQSIKNKLGAKTSSILEKRINALLRCCYRVNNQNVDYGHWIEEVKELLKKEVE